MVASRVLAATLAASGLTHASSGNSRDASQPVRRDFGPSVEMARSRGPQVFNAVHDTMRQWGESLHHNGMSFFLATVPEGVVLHHGNNDERSPDEPDWLAYEIEHAEGFARGGFGGPGGGGRGPPGRGGPPGSRPTEPAGGHQVELGGEHGQERIHLRAPEEEEERRGGWLHTYRAVRPLRYLYIDGMSGGKTQMGTLDSQDYLLRGTKEVIGFDDGKDRDDHTRRGGGPMDERARAIELCALCKDWNLSGVVRMEAGFEIIQCDFTDGLEQLQVLQRPDPGNNGGGPGRGGEIGSFEFIRGLAERYYDIGSSRTYIDYSSMVSAFFFPVNLTNPDSKRPDLPRLSNTTDAELAAIQGYLNRTISDRYHDPVRSIDWRDVTDLIVGRYADRIKYLADKATSVAQVRDEISFLLTVFIDFSGRDSDQIASAIDRCASFYLHGVVPTTEADRLIHAGVTAVTTEICTKLFDVRELVSTTTTSAAAGTDDEDDDSAATTMAGAVAALRSLMDYLGWARFKRCPACGVDEVCFVPMWPMGSKEDYDSPRCVNSSNQHQGENYWGGFGPPGHGPGRGGKDGKGGPPP